MWGVAPARASVVVIVSGRSSLIILSSFVPRANALADSMFRRRYGWISGRHRRCVEEQRLRDRSLHRGPLERLW
jgi:hypothetical protein